MAYYIKITPTKVPSHQCWSQSRVSITPVWVLQCYTRVKLSKYIFAWFEQIKLWITLGTGDLSLGIFLQCSGERRYHNDSNTRLFQKTARAFFTTNRYSFFYNILSYSVLQTVLKKWTHLSMVKLRYYKSWFHFSCVLFWHKTLVLCCFLAHFFFLGGGIMIQILDRDSIPKYRHMIFRPDRPPLTLDVTCLHSVHLGACSTYVFHRSSRRSTDPCGWTCSPGSTPAFTVHKKNCGLVYVKYPSDQPKCESAPVKLGWSRWQFIQQRREVYSKWN